MLWLDFETRSRCDLKARGVYNYARDLSTEVLCMSYAFDDDEVVTWRPGEPFPDAVRSHKGQIRAHNAAFERLIFWDVLGVEFNLEQFYCTAAQARANCAPGSLEDVGRFCGAGIKKDHKGSQLIRLLSIPQSDGQFRDDPDKMAEMVSYCEQDVRAMRAFSQAMRDLSPDELADYHVNERINDRGVLLDVPLARAAVRYAEAEAVEIEQIVREVTGGEITSVRSPRMREWVLSRVGPQALKLATIYKDGEPKTSIDRNVRASLLALAEEDPTEVPPDVADVIQCADDLWASSVAKFSRAASLADDEDSRVRGAFVFSGGSATGRASSYGLQVHNYPRVCADEPDAIRRARHGRSEADVEAIPDGRAAQAVSCRRLGVGRGPRDALGVGAPDRRWQARPVCDRAGYLQGERSGDVSCADRGSFQGPAPGREGPRTCVWLRRRGRRVRGDGPHL
jgi:DNA polymerase